MIYRCLVVGTFYAWTPLFIWSRDFNFPHAGAGKRHAGAPEPDTIHFDLCIADFSLSCFLLMSCNPDSPNRERLLKFAPATGAIPTALSRNSTLLKLKPAFYWPASILGS